MAGLVADIESVGQNGQESVAIYFKSGLGKFKITISSSLLYEVAIENGEDQFGTVYSWMGTGYVGQEVEDAFKALSDALARKGI